MPARNCNLRIVQPNNFSQNYADCQLDFSAVHGSAAKGTFQYLRFFPKRNMCFFMQRGQNSFAERKDGFFGKRPFPKKRKGEKRI